MPRNRRRPQQTDRGRHHADQTSKAMKRVAEHRRCPKCGRGNAIKRIVGEPSPDGWFGEKRCRWCDFKEAYTIAEPATAGCAKCDKQGMCCGCPLRGGDTAANSEACKSKGCPSCPDAGLWSKERP